MRGVHEVRESMHGMCGTVGYGAEVNCSCGQGVRRRVGERRVGCAVSPLICAGPCPCHVDHLRPGTEVREVVARVFSHRVACVRAADASLRALERLRAGRFLRACAPMMRMFGAPTGGGAGGDGGGGDGDGSAWGGDGAPRGGAGGPVHVERHWLLHELACATVAHE